jgi:hypothetical protein
MEFTRIASKSPRELKTEEAVGSEAFKYATSPTVAWHKTLIALPVDEAT